MLISFRNNHVFISGITRSGKTYFSAKALAAAKYPVIFFNLQDENLPQNFFVLPTHKIKNEEELIDYLKNGIKLDLRLPRDLAKANALIGHITNILMGAGFSETHPVYLVFDEAHLLKNYGKTKAIEAATRGLKRGVRCIFITQRPANCDKTLYTQSIEQYIFRMGKAEKEYMKNKGIDFKELDKIWSDNGPYSYAEFDGINLIGHKAVS